VQVREQIFVLDDWLGLWELVVLGRLLPNVEAWLRKGRKLV
jgi:hypothetical protein